MCVYGVPHKPIVFITNFYKNFKDAWNHNFCCTHLWIVISFLKIFSEVSWEMTMELMVYRKVAMDLSIADHPILFVCHVWLEEDYRWNTFPCSILSRSTILTYGLRSHVLISLKNFHFFRNNVLLSSKLSLVLKSSLRLFSEWWFVSFNLGRYYRRNSEWPCELKQETIFENATRLPWP